MCAVRSKNCSLLIGWDKVSQIFIVKTCENFHNENEDVKLSSTSSNTRPDPQQCWTRQQTATTNEKAPMTLFFSFFLPAACFCVRIMATQRTSETHAHQTLYVRKTHLHVIIIFLIPLIVDN